jgi:glycosyltransferase involved in cell wall biosynthesis
LKGLLENISLEVNNYNLSDELQIIIVDGHSKDDTEDMVNSFKIQCDLKYFRRQTNEGIDKDIIKGLELSDAKYCWLFSDDDRLSDGSLSYLLDVLRKEKNLTGCFINRDSYDYKLEKQVAEASQWPGKVLSANRLFTDKSECIKHIGNDIGFLSSQLINIDKWKKALGNEDYGELYNSCYMFVHIIFKMMNEDFKWLYIHSTLLKQRTGNDSFLSRVGVIKRQKIELDNLQNIFTLHYDVGSKEYHILLKKMLMRLPRVLANMKSQGITFSTQVYLFKLHLKKYGNYSRFWYTVLPIYLGPNIFFRYVKKFYFRFLV